MSEYARAGVDQQAHRGVIGRIAELARGASRPEVLEGVGLFAAASALPAGYREPVLVGSTDNVGTKVLLAGALGRHDTVGIDCVAMCVNDLITCGADPLFFLDYLALHRLEPHVVEAVVAGVAEGCRRAGCALVGGETAQSGDLIQPGAYDLSGTAVGVVERARLIRPCVRPGDLVVGLPSWGLHSNGFSLVRRILAQAGVDPALHAEVLLRPTRIYVREVRTVLDEGVELHGMAHITGGGLPGNLDRVLNAGCDIRLDPTTWEVPQVFAWLQAAGGVEDAEMHRVFNMGIGFCLVVPPGQADAACRRVEGATVIGEVVPGSGRVRWS